MALLNKKQQFSAILFSSLLTFFVINTSIAAAPPGFTTAPYKVTYTAKLTNAGGTPVTTAQSVRFSLWTDADWDGGDIDGLGDINTLSAGYAGWQETHTVTPNSEGIFSVELGSINNFPNFTLATHTYLEVDVKPSASANAAFEVLDPDGNTGNLTDRKSFNSSPYAVNADTVDNRDADNSANNIPVLDGLGKLVYGVIPDAVSADTFTLDVDNNAPSNIITLQFGNAIAEYLRWNDITDRFEFSDDVNIDGDLVFTGTGNITGATIDGTLNTITNIPITAIAPYAKTIRLSPAYDSATITPDGADNIGTMKLMYEDLGALAKYNFYNWSTNKLTAQDLDIVVRYQLPTDFVSFTASPLTLTYQTFDGVALDNNVSLTMVDSTGTAVALTGATNLTSLANWNDAAITFGGAPTFTPGTFIQFTIKSTSIAGKYARVGDLVLNYTGR